MTLPRAKLTPLTSSNLVCADCSDADPSWASLNRGVLICTECCSIHRSLGRHISHVKLLKRSTWNPKQLALVQTLYAHGSNNVWEHLLLDPVGVSKAKKKPGSRDPLYPTKADFIRAKYQNLSYALRPGRGGDSGGSSDGGNVNANPADLNRQLHSCVRTGHVETTLRLLALGADPNGYVDPETGAAPLHVAAREGQDLQVEVLFLYGGDMTLIDYSDQTPADVADKNGHRELSRRLLELQFEVTDRLTSYLCGGRKPDHQSGQHFIIPEVATGPDTISKMRKKRLQQLSDASLEKLSQDLYDEVDRREVDAAWSACLSEDALLINDRYVVPFLPVNADLPATRNQRRQKLAKFNPREFAAFLIDMLSEVKRRLIPASVQAEEKAASDQNRIRKTSSGQENSGSASSLTQVGSKNADQRNSADNDGPLYDSVPSDDETNGIAPETNGSGLSASAPTVTIDDYVDLKCQLAAAELRVEELQKRNSDVVNQVEQLRSCVDKLSNENRHMKTASLQYQLPHQLEPELLQALQTLHSPGSPPTTANSDDSREQSTKTADLKPEPRELNKAQSAPLRASNGSNEMNSLDSGGSGAKLMVNRHLQSSSEAVADNKRSSSPASSVDYDSIGSECHSVYPDNLIHKTEQLTAEIHRMLAAAQTGSYHRFASHAAQIQSIVDSMVHGVPAQFKTKPIEAALESMVDACIMLTVRCSSNSTASAGEYQEKYSFQVMQLAFEVAKSAKQVLVLIQQ